jgi:hypothetical protein
MICLAAALDGDAPALDIIPPFIINACGWRKRELPTAIAAFLLLASSLPERGYRGDVCTLLYGYILPTISYKARGFSVVFPTFVIAWMPTQ